MTAYEDVIKFSNTTGKWSCQIIDRWHQLHGDEKWPTMAYRRRVVERLWRMHNPTSVYGKRDAA